MKTMEMTCIRCPMGCRLTVTQDGDTFIVTGNTCRRGEEYGVQEMRCPMRTVTSSVRVEGGRRPVCSVKTAQAVRKADIGAVLAAIRALTVKAPVAIGDIVCPNVAGTGVNLVATAND
ncbi:MAG: DUF1667 domain-containing protein [Clostridia bacterium]|nr:DUF1667 domain-containing protein [Clostridia bacterium]